MKIYFLIAVSLLLSFSLVSASFIKANISIEKNYSPGENLRGWINISLQNEQASSLLTAFNSSITILDFLKNSDANYSCFPSDCQTGYTASTRETSKTFSLDSTTSRKIIGLKISGGIISEISAFSMNITSTAGELSYPQLFIDILNDNETESEWKSHTASGNFGNEIYGCYNQNDSTEQAEITQTEYCEKVSLPLPYAANMKIGVDIIAVPGKGGNVNFAMHIYNDNYDSSCTASAVGSGKISCITNLTVFKDKDFFVCIATKNSADNNKYKLNYEQTSPCGFSGDYNGYSYDFPIFLQTGKYAAVGNFVLDNNELEKAESQVTDIKGYIADYISEKYNDNCTTECIVPIKFISGKQQTVTISYASLSYNTGLSKTTHDLYDLTEESAKINMNFQKLNLEKANLDVPSEYGKKTLSLKLNEQEIANQEIEIAKVPVIDYAIPLSAPAAMPVKFIVFVSAGNVTGYKWDFGDETVVETTTNSTYHTYNSTGTYSMKISVVNAAGESSKTFSVSVVSPKDEINRTIAEKRKELNEAKKDIAAITGWYKAEIEKLADLGNIESTLAELEKKYAAASSSEAYVTIMTDLMELKVPSSLQSQVFSGAYLPDTDKINPNYLIELGVKGVENPEDYKESIVNWIGEFLNINIEGKKYSLKYENEEVPILTSFVLKITPKKEFGKETYLIIQESYDSLVFKEEYKEKAVDDATSITFSELKEGEEKSIEFVSPEKIEITELALYISPEFSQLPETGSEISPCNYDSKCQKELGENSTNCPADCKSWTKTITYLIILLFIAFIVYIILQEWYKRYYEKHLFKNRNDLFNLINFINNAFAQRLGKDEIIRKLKAYGWTGEQINYAIRKVLGKRTGMWEIPIFRWFEKRKMRDELRKRQQQGILKLPIRS